MSDYTEVTESTTVELVGQGPQTVNSGFLVPTERPGVFEHVNDRPTPDRDGDGIPNGVDKDDDGDTGEDGRADADGSRLSGAKSSTTSDASPASGATTGQNTGTGKR